MPGPVRAGRLFTCRPGMRRVRGPVRMRQVRKGRTGPARAHVPGRTGRVAVVDDGVRAALGVAQERLLAALVGGAEAPDGFDVERVRVQAEALRAKHAHTAAHAPDTAPTLRQRLTRRRPRR